MLGVLRGQFLLMLRNDLITQCGMSNKYWHLSLSERWQKILDELDPENPDGVQDIESALAQWQIGRSFFPIPEAVSLIDDPCWPLIDGH